MKVNVYSIQGEVKEEIEADMFGTIYHEVMENIYKPYVGKIVEDGDVRRQGQLEVHHFALGRVQRHVSQFVGQGEDGL